MPTTPYRKPQLDALAIGILLSCCILWGWQPALVKATLPEVPVVLQAALRFAVATILVVLWYWLRGTPLIRKGDAWSLGLLAGSLFASEFACISLALHYSTASRVTLFVYTSPFVVALLLPRFVTTERLRVLQWLGLVCAFAAVAFALREGMGGERHQQVWLGDLLALSGGVLWGITTVVIRASRLSRIPSEKLLLYQVGVSTVLLTIFSLAMDEPWRMSEFSHFAWISLAIQGVVVSFLSYLAWMWLLGHYPATHMAAFVFLTPLFALLFGALWLHEAVTPTLILALVGVAMGIVLVSWPKT